jgi:hypothetical protein
MSISKTERALAQLLTQHPQPASGVVHRFVFEGNMLMGFFIWTEVRITGGAAAGRAAVALWIQAARWRAEAVVGEIDYTH